MNAENGQCVNKCDNYPDCKPCGEYPLFTKSITFDYEAQQNLPEDIKAKMKADRKKAQNKL